MNKDIDFKRKCIVTNKIVSYHKLIRIVKTKDNNFFVDSKEKGRGAYITCDKDLIKIVLSRKVLNKAFRVIVPLAIYNELVEKMSECQNARK